MPEHPTGKRHLTPRKRHAPLCWRNGNLIISWVFSFRLELELKPRLPRIEPMGNFPQLFFHELSSDEQASSACIHPPTCENDLCCQGKIGILLVKLCVLVPFWLVTHDILLLLFLYKSYETARLCTCIQTRPASIQKNLPWREVLVFYRLSFYDKSSSRQEGIIMDEKCDCVVIVGNIIELFLKMSTFFNLVILDVLVPRLPE